MICVDTKIVRYLYLYAIHHALSRDTKNRVVFSYSLQARVVTRWDALVRYDGTVRGHLQDVIKILTDMFSHQTAARVIM